MKTILFVIILLSIPCLVKSQDTIKSSDSSNEKVYHVVDVMPSFPGGEEKFLEYISKNFHYPNSAAKDNIKGRILIQFVINESGEAENINIVKGIRQDVDQAAIDLIKSMPRWKPGLVGNKPVKVHYNLPINL